MKYGGITKMYKRLLDRGVKVHYQRVWNRYVEGLSEEDIYNEYIIPKQYKYNGIQWTTKIDNCITNLYNSGIKTTEISVIFGYGCSTIRNRLIKLGIHKKRVKKFGHNIK